MILETISFISAKWREGEDLLDTKRNRRKVGRNELCPCGSQKKYKHCHGKISNTNLISNSQELTECEIQQKEAELQAIEKQREQQQGLGRPIVSAYFKGYRFVAVGDTVLYSKSWKTFHDFLFDYIKHVFGEKWGNEQIQKEFKDRHPVLQWYDMVCKYQKETILVEGEIHSAPVTGAVALYFGLAYNLYLLAHNEGIQKSLIERIKSKDFGAYYEAFVAASFIKAGFKLEFENEADCSMSHCEFTATYRETGVNFSVEAKAREAGKSNAGVWRQLFKALRKKANHTRIVFIDVNMLDNLDDSNTVVQEALDSIRRQEHSLTINGNPAPEAYVVLTNYPYEYNLGKTSSRWSVLAEGFKIPDFGMDTKFSSIREAINAEKKHYEVYQLMDGIREYYQIPSTFDGEIPEFAFGKIQPRLRIGQKFLIPDQNNIQVVGELVDATVNESEKVACGIYKLEGGRSVIATSPLSEEELRAYRQYPDTFFGVYRKKVHRSENPLELFKFLLDTYQCTPKEKLLEFMEGSQYYEILKTKSQEELAFEYCEGLVYSILNSRKPDGTP